jgi:IgA Peptidase M64
MVHRLSSLMLLVAILSAPTSAQVGPTEWLHWDAPRADLSLYGGRISIPFVAPTTDVIPAPVTTLFGNNGVAGADNRVDLVMVGDGYTAAEQGQYQQDAATMAVAFFKYEPFTTYQNFFAVHTVTVVSNESGVDNDPTQGVNKDTALDMTFWCGGIERLLCVNVVKAYNYANNAPDVDQVIALANSSKYGGAGYTSSDLATDSGQNGLSGEVVVHELGHSFGNLADEYDYGGGNTWTGGEVPEPNASILDAAAMAGSGDKWADWLGYNDPAFDGLVGTYEGARYYKLGIYRPTNNSLMRALGRPFNPPSAENILIEMYKIVSPIEAAADDALVYDGSEVLWVQPMDLIGGPSLAVQWYLDGTPIAGATGNTLDLGTLGLSTCLHTVRVEVIDPTPWVLNETARNLWMRDEVSFAISVAPPGAVDCNLNGQADICEISGDPSLDWNGDGVLDECSPPNYCTATANSTGLPGLMAVSGSPVVADNQVLLKATQLATNQFGYFLMSDVQDFVPLFGGSSGNLCLGGNILRIVNPPAGQILNTGPSGSAQLQVDLTWLPGGTTILPGEHWYFQMWFRDVGPTSNTTDGLDVMFR